MHTRPLRLALLVLLLVSVAVACGPAATPVTPTAVPATVPATEPATVLPTDTPVPTATAEPTEEPTPAPTEPAGPTPLPEYEAASLSTQRGSVFVASGVCASCHTNLTDEAGNDVSIDTDWRGAIMANSARDPYWEASVRSEVLDHPALESAIEEKCATCHAPMARTTAASAGDEVALFGGFFDPDHPLHTFAIDGVSCSLCHQIEEEGLDDPDSFSGGFVVDVDAPQGERPAYGPFPPVQGPAALMQRMSGYVPVEGPHTLQSEHCAPCHTLYTSYVDDEGEVAGTFPEQTPYLEWEHSDYEETHACQDCHMPPAEGALPIASTGGGPPRSPFARHQFIGGNTYMLRMLWAFGEELGVTASSDHFARKIEQTLVQLQERTATLAIEELTVGEGDLSFDVVVENQAGHKFPSGYPSRRAWLHVTVADDEGNTVFESGAVNADGSIVGNDNDGDAAVHEPHYQEISDPEQVQIYEPILETVSGEVTTGLMRAAGYQKDNRLLPSGFDKASAGEDIAVYGDALDDEDFEGGADRVRYVVDLSDARGTLTVTVELLYQSIGYRWADNLRRHDAAEVTRFVDAYDDLPNQPVVIAEASVAVGP